MKYALALTSVVIALGVSGCSTYVAPISVENSEPIWPEVPEVVVSQNTEGLVEYRVGRDAKSRAGSPHKLERWLENTASKFCAHQGAHYQLLRERKGFPDFNGTARVELIFCCTKDASKSTFRANAKVNKRNAKEMKMRYELLTELKELYDAGGITKEEYELEKKKILSSM